MLSISVSLLVLSSSGIVVDEKKKNRRLRGNTVEDIKPKPNEGVMGIKDTHHRDHDGLVDFLEPPFTMPVYHHNETNVTRLLSSNYGNEDITIYHGNWGGWKNWQKTSQRGLYACGAELRFENSQGGGDDTAANGLKLKYCGLSDWYNQQEQTIWNGNWGGWKGWVMCSYGKYIGAARVRFEDSQGGGDDTALNGLQIYCVDKNWINWEFKTVYNGNWGQWKGWSYRWNKLVKGARVRFEDNQGGGDDTAMNGLQFNVEEPNFGISRSQITGEWVAVTSGPQGQFEHKIIESTETTNSKELTKEEAYGFEQSISAGFKIKVVDFSVDVSFSQSIRTAQTMSHSLRVYHGTETTFKCPTSGSPTGYFTMWKFVMSQPSDSSGIGFTSRTKHIRCTPSFSQPPRCALGNCQDLFCQECFQGRS